VEIAKQGLLMTKNSQRPMVSVALITFNHEQFIEQAIASVFDQKCDFSIELVISDDCSTDSTAAIIEAMCDEAPIKVRVIDRPENVGMMINFQETLEACEGKYVALLEGDDYWSDSSKLQKQIEFLEQHPETVICHHNALTLYDDARESSLWHKSSLPKKETVFNFFSENRIVTCTTVYRNDLFEFPDWFRSCHMGDWPLHILNAQHGDVAYLDEDMAVYRVHAGGHWSRETRKVHLQMMIESMEKIRPELPEDQQVALDIAQDHRHAETIELLILDEKRKDALDYTQKHFEEQTIYDQLIYFYDALEAEKQGRRCQAIGKLFRAFRTTLPASRVKRGDVLIALSRCMFPLGYKSIRVLYRACSK